MPAQPADSPPLLEPRIVQYRPLLANTMPRSLTVSMAGTSRSPCPHGTVHAVSNAASFRQIKREQPYPIPWTRLCPRPQRSHTLLPPLHARMIPPSYIRRLERISIISEDDPAAR